ncbi:MAG TPA: hypothetical protein VFI08_02770 [Spirochaetia bacterium]|nr:hypothetical protein [Spirochaetia bacterium]
MISIAAAVAAAAGITAVTLALAGCAPPYLEALDQAANVVGKMALVGTIGPMDLSDRATNLRFYPAKPTASSVGGIGTPCGFAVWDDGANENISFLSGSGGSGGGQSNSLAGADPNYPLYDYAVMNTISGTAAVMVIHYDPTAAASQYLEYNAPLSTGVMTQVGSWTGVNGALLPSGWIPIGGAVQPALPPTLDNYGALFINGGTVGESGASFNGTGGFVAGSAPSPDTTAPATVAGLTRALYYAGGATNTNFVSYYSGGNWICYKLVPSTSSTLMSGITHRVDGFLSTGDVLSTDGGMLRLYNTSGTGSQRWAMQSGGLQFCYEAYVGSTLYAFFSLALPLTHGKWIFNVYAIPTSSMQGLG